MRIMNVSTFRISRCIKRILSTSNGILNQLQVRTFLFFPSSSQSKIKYNDTAIVQCPQALLYDIVADVDRYYQFVPNCFESTVLEQKSPALLRAKLTVGIPQVISADYISTVSLSRPNRILTRSEENRFMRYLESEWKFEPVTTRGKESNTDRTLVKFRVEFEMYSQLTANLVGLVFDDFTRKTMEAFLTRAEVIHRRNVQQQLRQAQQQSTDSNKNDNNNTTIPRR